MRVGENLQTCTHTYTARLLGRVGASLGYSQRPWERQVRAFLGPLWRSPVLPWTFMLVLHEVQGPSSDICKEQGFSLGLHSGRGMGWKWV